MSNYKFSNHSKSRASQEIANFVGDNHTEMSIVEMSRHLNISKYVIKSIIKLNDLQKSTKKHCPKHKILFDEKSLLYDYCVLKLSTSQIAKKYNCSGKTVSVAVGKVTKLRTIQEAMRIVQKTKLKNSPKVKKEKNEYITVCVKTEDLKFLGENNRSGRIAEHRLVMSKHLCRPLLGHENVHHINGIKSDNRIENLELWSTSQVSGQRVVDKVLWAKQILMQYENDIKSGKLK